MRHEKTKRMQDYWMHLFTESGMEKDGLGRSIWPERTLVQPMDCPELLGDMFILDTANGANTYRLAGTRLCATVGKELKGHAFANSFQDEDQHAAESWIAGLAQDDYLVLICSDGMNREGEIIPLETVLMPLNYNGQRGERAIGLTVPLEMPSWLASTPIITQSIRSVRVLRPWESLENNGNSFKRTNLAEAAPSVHADLPHMTHEPLVTMDGNVRGAPFLRVLAGGRE